MRFRDILRLLRQAQQPAQEPPRITRGPVPELVEGPDRWSVNKTIDIRKNKTDNLPTPYLSVNYNDAVLNET